MSYMDELARKWREHDRSFEGRDVLPNGDEVWTYTTLELGLPVLWLKHPDGSFEYRVIHTPGYDQDIDILSSPTEEASYPDDNLEPESEWLD